MKLHILGSCSGTEPAPGRRHTAFALETADGLSWFDAGEGCSYTAHIMGLDLLSVREIIISHPHIDHVGGLGNLLWNIRKLRYTKNQPLGHDINVWLPSYTTYEGVMKILSQSEGGFATDFGVNFRQVKDGRLFGGSVEVSALHNLHLGEPSDGIWRSFSFRIVAEGKTIVYSGDIKSISELAPWLDCDLLLMETGHHDAAECAAYLSKTGYSGTLLFTHHGRAMLDDPHGQQKAAAAAYGGPVYIADDALTFTSGVEF